MVYVAPRNLGRVSIMVRAAFKTAGRKIIQHRRVLSAMLTAEEIAGLLPSSVLRTVGRLSARHAGLHRLTSRMRQAGPVTIRRGPASGMRIWSDGRSNLGYSLGTTELAVQAALEAHVRRGQVCYDIGANVGFFTMIAARLVGPEGHVYAFEPLPENAAALRRNRDLNKLEQVEVVQAAVSDYAGEASLVVGRSSLDPRLSEHVPEPENQVGGQITVSVVRLDDRDFRPPDFVKIDAEGAEFSVLAGMRQMITEHRPTILCEMHGMSDSHIADVRAALGEAASGYALSFIEHRVDAGFWAPHVLAVPR